MIERKLNTPADRVESHSVGSKKSQKQQCRQWSAKLLALSALLLVSVSFPVLVPVANASDEASQHQDQRKYDNIKTQQRQSVSQSCAKKLESVQAILGSEDAAGKEKEASAKPLQGLVDQLNSSLAKSCSTSYEKSQVYNLLGFVYYSLNDIKQAVVSYKAMVAEPDADARHRIDTYYTLAQLYMMLDDYSNAAGQLKQWMSESDVVSPDSKVLLAQVYYQLDRKDEALVLVNQAIDSVLTQGNIPKENWWLLQKVLYFEKSGASKHNNKKVIAILKQLITHYPKHLYWHQLGGMYGEIEDNSYRLAALDILYLDKALTKSQDLLSLAYLYLGADVPYRAAQIIEKGIQQGVIESTGKNLELLGGAWQQARETEKALVPLEKAAKLSDAGAIWSRLAMVYLDLDNNSEAVKAARLALQKGQLKHPAYTRMTLGNALVNLNCYHQAAEVFGEAAKDSENKKTAEQWQAYVLSEAERRDSLVESGAKIAQCQMH